MKKNDNPFSVYATVSQLGFVIITPLLLFLGGGSWAVGRFGLPDWMMGVFVALGLIFMIGGTVSYLYQLVKIYGKQDGSAPKSFTGSPRDNDYYDEYKDMRK